MENSGTSVRSSTFLDKDSETRSEGQTSEDVEEEGGPAPSKRLIQWGKDSQNLEKDLNWVYRLLDTAPPKYNYEQPLVLLVNIFNEDFCPFGLFFSATLINEFFFYYVQFKQDMELKDKIK